MRNSKILAKIRAGKPARLAMMGHFIPIFVAHAANLGYDGIWLDLEHRAMDSREVQAMLAFFHLYDIDCMVRVPTREKGQLYRYLEDGATGLMIPHVSDVEFRARTGQPGEVPAGWGSWPRRAWVGNQLRPGHPHHPRPTGRTRPARNLSGRADRELQRGWPPPIKSPPFPALMASMSAHRICASV